MKSKKGTTLKDAIHLAGGFAPSGRADTIFVERKGNNTSTYLRGRYSMRLKASYIAEWGQHQK